VWNTDLTACPIAQGFWVPWLPRAVRQSWPFAWWLMVIVDHYSRKMVGVRVFASQPTSEQVCALLTETTLRYGTPKYIVSDRGAQFTSSDYAEWCKDKGVEPRFGALGKHGSIALTERVIQTIKQEGLRWILMPLSLARMQSEVDAFVLWFDEHRPHRSLSGATPNEVYEGRPLARDGPRFEPRRRYPLGRTPSSGAPKAVRGRRGARLRLGVRYVEGRKHLPVVELRWAA
jgi:transposase InsO family protein